MNVRKFCTNIKDVLFWSGFVRIRFKESENTQHFLNVRRLQNQRIAKTMWSGIFCRRSHIIKQPTRSRFMNKQLIVRSCDHIPKEGFRDGYFIPHCLYKSYKLWSWKHTQKICKISEWTCSIVWSCELKRKEESTWSRTVYRSLMEDEDEDD